MDALKGDGDGGEPAAHHQGPAISRPTPPRNGHRKRPLRSYRPLAVNKEVESPHEVLRSPIRTTMPPVRPESLHRDVPGSAPSSDALPAAAPIPQAGSSAPSFARSNTQIPSDQFRHMPTAPRPRSGDKPSAFGRDGSYPASPANHRRLVSASAESLRSLGSFKSTRQVHPDCIPLDA